ncbi:hypothetical protein [Mesobacillus maritimus]|uniref:hypothetical protein n=1 Tax=Mesobacillus maritimus TaxID=1643336 RepID=UPI00384D4380
MSERKKVFVVRGEDVRGHFVEGKVFEDPDDARVYEDKLNSVQELYLYVADTEEMEYVTKRKTYCLSPFEIEEIEFGTPKYYIAQQQIRMREAVIQASEKLGENLATRLKDYDFELDKDNFINDLKKLCYQHIRKKPGDENE